MPGGINLLLAKLLDWLDNLRIYSRIIGEFGDSALINVIVQAGTGIFITPTPIAREVAKQYRLQIIGGTEEVCEQYYAISVGRRFSHAAVSAITETACAWLGWMS